MTSYIRLLSIILMLQFFGVNACTGSKVDQDEIKKAQMDPLHKLVLKFNAAAIGEEKRRGPRYTPLSKRQDRPASILWLVKFHPELTDGQISKLVGLSLIHI